MSVDVPIVAEQAPFVPPLEPHWVPPIGHTLALFTVMRTTEAFLWPHPFAESSHFLDHYKDAYGNPPLFDPHRKAFEWDGDRWPINVIGHGLLGSELHLRARTCGASVLEALAFTAGASATWEYVVEANGTRPSALDLVYTPLAGLVFGEARFQAWRAAGGIGSPVWRGVVRAVVDPFGELERGVGTVC